MFRRVFVIRTEEKDRGWERRWVEVRRRWKHRSLSILVFWGNSRIYPIYLISSLSLWICLHLFTRFSIRYITCIKTRWKLKMLSIRLFCLVVYRLEDTLNHQIVGKVLSRSIRNQEFRFSILRLSSPRRKHWSLVGWGYTRRGWISWEFWEIGRVCWRWVVRVKPDTVRLAEIAILMRFLWNPQPEKYRRRIWKQSIKAIFMKRNT